MSQTGASMSQHKYDASVGTVDMKLEVDRHPGFGCRTVQRSSTQGLGGGSTPTTTTTMTFACIQFTPPGSACSIIFGKNVTAAAPGSAQGLYLIVADIEAARENLLRRGVKVSEVFHGAGDVYAGPDEPYLFGRHSG